MNEETQVKLLELAVGITRSLIEAKNLSTSYIAARDTPRTKETDPAQAVSYYFNHLKSLMEPNT